MDALKNLNENIPDWIKKLEELNSQVAQRQMELASVDAAGASGPAAAAARSLGRNKGSTESLKPHGEPAAHPDAHVHGQHGHAHERAPDETDLAAPSSTGSTASQVQRQAAAIEATKQAGETHAHNTLRRRRRRRRTDSMMTAEGAPKYRSRAMIMVYYDSYVQTFFDDLSSFLAVSRNMMRKAKMAAKVERVRRFAGLSSADEQELDEKGKDKVVVAEQPASPTTTSLHLDSGAAASNVDGGGASPTHRITSYDGGGGGGGGDDSNIWDELDRGLERVQTMCGQAAHQFLRDGDCADEVADMERQLRETKAMAERETVRLEGLETAEEDVRNRAHGPGPGQGLPHVAKVAEGGGLSVPELAAGVLEVDEAIDGMDDDYDDDKPVPRPMYRSTRAMRRVGR